ncbi:hypothetical protein Q763_07465 [Flavobacterium beibuense F44-8]|uniref:Uncharacterized protein n=1 Tax=Flavobacterium beibuense F44-8 TaxID=1406840 RepID=A0A0A2LQG9_9FLAO|nr:hypothetical protein Q763_07465 [Flavobacterium beibuense F44-8]
MLALAIDSSLHFITYRNDKTLCHFDMKRSGMRHEAEKPTDGINLHLMKETSPQGRHGTTARVKLRDKTPWREQITKEALISIRCLR